MIRVWPVALCLSILCGPVWAGDPPPPDETKTKAKDREEFTYLTDGRGHYLVVDDRSHRSRLLYYGDERNVYRLVVSGYSRNTTKKQRMWSIWSPQARATTRLTAGAILRGAQVVRTKNKWIAKCGERVAKFFPVDPKARAKLRKLRFRGPYHHKMCGF